MWFTLDRINSRDKRSETKCQGFQRKSDSLLYQRTAFPMVWSFFCAGVKLTVSASLSGSQPKEKWQRYGCWSIHSFVLYPPETLTVKRL